MTPLQEGEFYCTKWAFGEGIVTVFSHDSRYPNSYSRDGDYRLGYYYLTPSEVHGDWSSAMKEVERMRTKKLASLEKQIAKVKSKTFKQP